MTIGIAIAAAPRRNAGARNDTSADPHQPLPAGQVVEQRLVERLSRVQHGVVDPMLGESRPESRDVLLNERSVLGRERFGYDGQLLAAFQILEARRLVV